MRIAKQCSLNVFRLAACPKHADAMMKGNACVHFPFRAGVEIKRENNLVQLANATNNDVAKVIKFLTGTTGLFGFILVSREHSKILASL